MPAKERLGNDPRTVARDIPGVFEVLFPQLVPGVVAHFNRMSYSAKDCVPVPTSVIDQSNLHRAMLFELAVAATEQLMTGSGVINWEDCLRIAGDRQRRHFDAVVPTSLSSTDMCVAQLVANNLHAMISQLTGEGEVPTRGPSIPGYQWIASGKGDFSIGTRLVEVKCTSKHFSSSDYRQVVMYWLLSYASSVETDSVEWSDVILLNPRLNYVLQVSFDEILNVIAAGRSKVELLEIFTSMASDHSDRLVEEVQ